MFYRTEPWVYRQGEALTPPAAIIAARFLSPPRGMVSAGARACLSSCPVPRGGPGMTPTSPARRSRHSSIARRVMAAALRGALTCSAVPMHNLSP